MTRQAETQSVAVSDAIATPSTLPLEYFQDAGKYMFHEPYHLFDEADLESVKQGVLSNGNAAIGGVGVQVMSEGPAFLAQQPILVLEALGKTQEIVKSLFPNATIGWEPDQCDWSRVVFVVNYNAADTLDDATLYESHQRLLDRFHDEVSAEAREGVSLERIID